MVGVHVRTIAQEYPKLIETEEGLREYYRRVSTNENFDRLGISPWFVVAGLPLTMFAFGLFLDFAGTNHSLVKAPALFVTWLDLFILLFLMLWGDKHLLKTMLKIRSAFATEDNEYYRFVGRFLQRLYEPSPFAGRGEGIRIHLGSMSSYGLTFALLLLLVTQLPEQLIVLERSAPSAALQAYVILTIALLSFGLSHGFWITGCLVWFMGHRAAKLPIRLSAVRSIDNLGLEPYGKFILHGALIGFLGLIVTGLGYLLSPHPLLMAVTILGSILFIGWYIGAQYGLHRSMVQAKKDRLDELNDAYMRLNREWWDDSTSEISTEDALKNHCLIGFKCEIEDLPTWPGRSEEFAQIGTAAIVSHIPFYLEYFELV